MHGADAGAPFLSFFERNFLPEKAGSRQLAVRAQETAKAAVYIRAWRRVKEAGGACGGKSEFQAAEQRLCVPHGPFVPEHRSHLTPPACNELG